MQVTKGQSAAKTKIKVAWLDKTAIKLYMQGAP
jgi:hypothetical protein